MSIRESVDNAPMSRLQITVVGICLVLSMVDGFDILVMSFAASGVAAEWSLSGSQIGILLSAGLAGMALGSAFVAPLADRVGRRPLVLGCLVASTLGMALAAVTSGFVGLGLCRLLTGVGIGGLVAGLPVIVSEYSPRRRRGTTIALYATGLPLGGVVGGAVAALVTTELGWRATFVVGAALSLLMLLVVQLRMPESIDYLVARRPARALETVNLLLRRMRLAPIDALPEPEPESGAGVRAAVLTGRNGVRSVLLWIAFFFMMAGFYFAASWTPRLLEQSGLTAQQGMSGGVLLNLGGVAATLLFSVLAVVVAGRTLTVVSFVAAGVSFLAMGSVLGNLPATLVVAVAIGVFVNAAGAGLYVLGPDLYPTAVRTTAVGWASAVGRLGAIVSPVLVGLLVDRGWSAGSLFLLFAVPMLLAGLAVVAVTTIRPSAERPDTVNPLGDRS